MKSFDTAPMSPVQVGAVAIAFILSALDGYDVLSVTFAAPAISAVWQLGKAALGAVLAAGLAGMALGAFLIAPLADLAGRKTVILASLSLMAAGMLLSANAVSPSELAGWRVVTGLGIGACVAVINPIAAEFANARRRALAVSIMAIGYPIGGVIGGVGAALLLRDHGWPAVFLAGFAAAALLFPLILWALPESPAFLIARGRAADLARLNTLLVSCRLPPLDGLPDEPRAVRRGYRALFVNGQLPATLWLTGVMMLFTANVYYVLSWMPQMVADSGFPPSTASLVSAASSLAGAIGGLTLGWLAQRGGMRWLTAGSLTSVGLATILFGYTPPDLGLLIAAAGLVGFFLFGAASGSYATIATTFRDETRATGSGFVSGMGRVSSAIAPSAAGGLLTLGLDRAAVSVIFGAMTLAAAAILFFGWRAFRSG